MKSKRIHGWIGGAGLCLAVLWALPVSAQTTFSSGSTGALGAFVPCTPTPCTVTVTLPPDGVLNYTTINIPSGVTVTFTPNAANTPVTMLATGDVTISGSVQLVGSNGIAFSSSTVNRGGPGGPGGFAGGQSGSKGQTNNPGSAGQGPGGGSPLTTSCNFCSAGHGTYGAPASFVTGLPLLGGSGGGGTPGTSTDAGFSGGGGGGAIVIASTTKITVNGVIAANGGSGGIFGNLGGCLSAGSGSGGAIRLVAPQITNNGTLGAIGQGSCSGSSGPGLIRLEAVAFGFVNPTNPTASTSNTRGPITANSTPALINLPMLTISSVGGIASPATPGGSYTTADVSLPSGTTNPVPVTVTVANTPLNTTFTVKVIPQFADPSTATCSNTTGSFTASTCTANVTLPSGFITVLNAFASFTLTASLFPLIDGEEMDRVLVAATYGESSTVTLITKSGKEVRADKLPLKDQLAFAKGWEAMLRDR